MNALRGRAGRLAMVGALFGMVAALAAPHLGGVSAGPSDPAPVETTTPEEPAEPTAPESGPPTTDAETPPTTLDTDAPDTTVIDVDSTTTTEPPVSEEPAEPDATEPEPTTTEALAPDTTTPETEAPETSTPDGAVVPAAPGDPYDVTVTAVCDVGFQPAIHIENTGLNTARVNVGRQWMDLAANEEWHLPWPTTDGDPPPLDPEPKWDAFRLDVNPPVIFENGTLSLPADCPPANVPSAPQGLTSTAGDASVALSWSAPAPNGGSAVTDYTIEHNAVPFDDNAWTPFDDGVGTGTNATVTGLTNGETYMVRIRAVNANGAGVSAEGKDTPNVPATEPTEVAVAPTTARGQLRLTWAPPTDGAPIGLYAIERSLDGTNWTLLTEVGGDSIEHLDAGLTRPQRYYYRIAAYNSRGQGPWSAVVSAVPNDVPTAPRSLAAAPTNVSGQVRLTWTAPTSNGGLLVEDYIILRLLSGTTTWVTVNDGVNTNTSYVATGLSNGSRYYFIVRAKSDVGVSANSNTANVIPRTIPTAPRSLTAAATGFAGQIRLSWYAPISNGGSAIIDYIIQRSPNGTSSWTTIADGVNVNTAYTVTGLVTGTRYYFRVYAKNAAGSSPSSNVPSAVPTNVLTAPRSLTATPTNVSGQIRLAWLAPLSNGGSAITDYVILRSPNGSTSWTTIADGVNANTAYTVTGLSNGVRYYFRVYARTARATSPWSNVANGIPRTVPSAARSLTAAPNNLSGQVRLTWLAPASNGGSAITDYLIQRSPNGTSSWTNISDGVSTATTYTVTGLTNGARYYFRVYARNAAGWSPVSAVASAIPRTVPSAPRNLVGFGTVEYDYLNWDVPAWNGGSPIIDYVGDVWDGDSWVRMQGSVTGTEAYIGVSGTGCSHYRVAARNAAGTGAFAYVFDVCYP